jgi:hypothetical protein
MGWNRGNGEDCGENGENPEDCTVDKLLLKPKNTQELLFISNRFYSTNSHQLHNEHSSQHL